MTAGFLTRFLKSLRHDSTPNTFIQLIDKLLKHPFIGNLTLPMTMDTYLKKKETQKAVSFYETALKAL